MSKNKNPIITDIKNITCVMISALFVCSIPIYEYSIVKYPSINKVTIDVKNEYDLLVNNLDKNIEEYKKLELIRYNGKTEEEYYKHIREENVRLELDKKINPQNYPGMLSLVAGREYYDYEGRAELYNIKSKMRDLKQKIKYAKLPYSIYQQKIFEEKRKNM